MRLAIAEDSNTVRASLMKTISRHPGVEVVGQARSEDEAAELIERTRPDVALIDLRLDPGCGLRVLRRLRQLAVDTRFLLLEEAEDSARRAEAIEAGADAFVDKFGNGADLLELLSQPLPPQPANEAERQRAANRARMQDSLRSTTFDAIARLASDLAGVPMAGISLVGATRQWFVSRVGFELEETSRNAAFCAHTIAAEGLMEVPDASRDPRFRRNPLVGAGPGVRFYAGVPLVLPGGEALGALCVMDTVPRTLTRSQRTSLRVLARSIVAEIELGQRVAAHESEVLRREQAEAQAARLATRDALTGLPNRNALIDRLQQCLALARRNGSTAALITLDLDGFTRINDALGQDVGDAVLRSVAGRLGTVLRESDTVARLGPDEFALLLPGSGNAAGAAVVAQKVRDVLSEPLHLDGRELHLEFSLGIALHPEHGADADTLLRHADLALSDAREAGGGRTQVYATRIGNRAFDRVALESELCRALERDELQLVYQPQVRLGDYRVDGLEALVRWNHPQRGLLMPDRFIRLAEDRGLIQALGERVLDLGLAQAAAWRSAGLNVPRLSINVSAMQLRDDFPALVDRLLARHGLAPQALELELTESALTGEGGAAMDLLRQLRGRGVSIAVDDFGVGYSSLAVLRRLPLDTLKIDRRFVAEIESCSQDVAIVKAITAMARNLGLRTVAEGVETLGQNLALRVLGCDSGQGYLYRRPADADSAAGWLTAAGAERLEPSSRAAVAA